MVSSLLCPNLLESGVYSLQATAFVHLKKWFLPSSSEPEPNGRRGQKLTYPDVLVKDTGIRLDDLGEAMGNRVVWGNLVNSMVLTDVEQL